MVLDEHSSIDLDPPPAAPPRPGRRRALIAAALAVVVCAALTVGGYLIHRPPRPTVPGAAVARPTASLPTASLPAGARPAGSRAAAPPPAASAMPSTHTDPDPLTFRRVPAPDRTIALDGAGTVVATFTDGARTVVLTGASRTFTEPAHTTTGVTGTAWVRLSPRTWYQGAEHDEWARTWLAAARHDTSPDVLGVAMQYLQGAPDRRDDKGVRYAGNASFGPVSAADPDGRAENSDFLDYLGISYTFPGKGRVAPNPSRYGDVDCSGFLRLVYGYREGYPLRDENTAGVGLPRRAFAISEYGPGVEVVANRGVPATGYDRLQPGDLVFFNSDPGTGPFRTDHSGIYLGRDAGGHYRFVSSRTKADGPTFGDTGGAAVLDGGEYWSQRWRNARRL